MILEFEEQIINDFLIPAFTLSEREIIIIHGPNGPFFSALLFPLVAILTGKTPTEKVRLHANLEYATPPKEGWFRSRFNPITVREYLEKNAGPKKEIASSIYSFESEFPVLPDCLIQALEGGERKYLSIATAFSNVQNVVFDLAGVAPMKGIKIYEFVKKTVCQEGGAAILIDGYFEFKSDCTKFIEAKYVGTD